jgi:transposase
MKLHANARLSVKGRELLVDRVERQGWSLAAVAAAAGVSDRTACKWVGRWRADGEAGLLDRPTTPKSSPTRTPEDRVQAIAALRRLRMTGAEIAECLGMALSTVSGTLRRIGMGKLGRLGLEPAERYERSRPGELLHIDVKKLGRIQVPGHRVTGNRAQRATRTRVGNDGRLLGTVGWEFVHVCIDDATRLAYAEVLDDEKGSTAVGFLGRAVAFYASYGITVEQLITDNGSAYRSVLHAIACRALGIRHLRTRPLPTTDQREGGEIHPYHARRLGLRSALPQQPRAHRSATRLARALQLATTTRRPQPQTTRSSPPRAEQTPRVLHLAARGAPAASRESWTSWAAMPP